MGAKRSANSHVLKQRAHPYRVHLPACESSFGGLAYEAANRLSDGKVFSWCPSRIYPPVTVFGFQTLEARDAFTGWVTAHMLGVRPTTTEIR